VPHLSIILIYFTEEEGVIVTYAIVFSLIHFSTDRKNKKTLKQLSIFNYIIYIKFLIAFLVHIQEII